MGLGGCRLAADELPVGDGLDVAVMDLNHLRVERHLIFKPEHIPGSATAFTHTCSSHLPAHRIVQPWGSSTGFPDHPSQLDAHPDHPNQPTYTHSHGISR
ncbi:hypothetical protein BRADI_3g21355v3 [Brachypodium distachyon]|uniref:Uncharacterized protein n=1 Tax=Brachypodium distachyon TaxID=15368 RepID=A0A2K2CYM8_BRADI|nr:hypothetical protein BRADI_3g21355v3 [Brachypodium distachyon]